MSTGDECPAVDRARTGADAWTEVVRHQRAATTDHADFYALAAEIVTTLHALDDLAALLDEQVLRYPQGPTLYDDTRVVEPLARLDDAAAEIRAARSAIVTASRAANRFWSLIGHIGIEVLS